MGWEGDLKSEMKWFITLLAPIKPYFRLEILDETLDGNFLGHRMSSSGSLTYFLENFSTSRVEKMIDFDTGGDV